MSYQHFTNTSCEYYPCKDVPRLNCLFCYCPLYHFRDCGGDFTILGNGLKDCSRCARPHQADGYDFVVDRLMRETPTRFVATGGPEVRD
jgi:Zn-finger protein